METRRYLFYKGFRCDNLPVDMLHMTASCDKGFGEALKLRMARIVGLSERP
jgi:hypothetical protein